MRLNSLLIRSALVGALGGLLFGFDTAVISGTTHQLTDVFSLTAGQLGFTVSIALIGTVIGALTSGQLGQRVGARQALALDGSPLHPLCHRLRVFVELEFPARVSLHRRPRHRRLFRAGPRIHRGDGAGRASAVCMVGLFQINIVVGILLAYGSNYGFASAHLGLLTWRWELGIAGLPALLFLIMLFGVPRSARWLLTKNRIEEARESLGLLGSPDPQAEIDELRQAIHAEAANSHAPLFTRKLMLPIFLAVTIGMFNQLAGINAILYYLSSIFTSAGFSSISGDEQSVLIGLMNLVATLIGMSLIDKIGRKLLLLIGAVGMAITLGAVSAVFHTDTHKGALLWLLIVYIFFFAISQGAVVWVYISEVFPTRVRSEGQALGSGANWVTNAAISFLFPVITAHSAAAAVRFFQHHDGGAVLRGALHLP